MNTRFHTITAHIIATALTGADDIRTQSAIASVAASWPGTATQPSCNASSGAGI
jgi:hypothetical protein